MDLRVVWSPEAVEDVEALAEYIARDSDFYAKAVVTKLLAAARDLKALALRGRPVPELVDPSFRERFVYSYRLIYRVEARTATVVAVIHGARLLGPALESRLEPRQ